jgi:hypothetical protein
MDAGILPTDPLGPVMEELADIPGEIERRIAPLLAEVRAATAKPPILASEIKALNAAAARHASNELPYAIMKLTATTFWRTSLLAGAAGLGLLLAGLGGGYWWGRSTDAIEINRSLDALPAAALQFRPTDAAQWLKLIQNNDITKALAACADPRTSPDGRPACNLPVWLGPAPPPSRGK